MTNQNPMTIADFYKIGHLSQYPNGTEIIYTTMTARGSRIKGVTEVVAYGFQGVIKEYLINYFNENFFKRPKEEIIRDYKRTIYFSLINPFAYLDKTISIEDALNSVDATHIAELHDLGYLPIRIKAVPEGTLVPLRVPMLTIENTNKKFYWLTNFLETVLSAEMWQPITSATISRQYRKILDRYAMETVGNVDHVPFSAHDFSFRGMVGRDGGAKSGAGHLLSFVGTDTIPAIKYHEEYYNANIEKELVGTSISATEHSVMCANSDADVRDEYESFRRLIEDIYPHGFVSIVSDTYDFWKVVGEVLPKLKDKIMARNGKVVIRPDSGDPVDIICGRYIPEIKNDEYVKSFEDAKASFYEDLMDELREDTPHGEYGDDSPRGKFKYDGKYYELIIDVEWNRYDKQYYYIDGHRERSCKEFTPSLSHLGLIEALWNIFGGEVNELGYKVLDSHIGAIYGDSITPERAEAICSRLKEKGFASSNIVLGVGSYSFQYTTRDTFSMAYKATWSMINGEEKQLFKDPKTDSGTKRSQRGLVVVTNRTEDGSITLLDGLNLAQKEQMAEIDLLQDVFVDGKLVRDDSLSAIRSRLAGA